MGLLEFFNRLRQVFKPPSPDYLDFLYLTWMIIDSLLGVSDVVDNLARGLIYVKPSRLSRLRSIMADLGLSMLLSSGVSQQNEDLRYLALLYEEANMGEAE